MLPDLGVLRGEGCRLMDRLLLKEAPAPLEPVGAAPLPFMLLGLKTLSLLSQELGRFGLGLALVKFLEVDRDLEREDITEVAEHPKPSSSVP